MVTLNRMAHHERIHRVLAGSSDVSWQTRANGRDVSGDPCADGIFFFFSSSICVLSRRPRQEGQRFEPVGFPAWLWRKKWGFISKRVAIVLELVWKSYMVYTRMLLTVSPCPSYSHVLFLPRPEHVNIAYLFFFFSLSRKQKKERLI